MKKLFKENPQRLVFWVGFIVVVILVLVGVGYTVYIIRTAKTEETETEESETVSVDISKVSSTWGTIVSITDKNLELKDSLGKTNNYPINDKTSINKGEALSVIKVSDLKVGDVVTLTYNISDLGAYNIFIGGTNEE
jgi:hypothetical protein